jgi:hypothetical protein
VSGETGSFVEPAPGYAQADRGTGTSDGSSSMRTVLGTKVGRGVLLLAVTVGAGVAVTLPAMASDHPASRRARPEPAPVGTAVQAGTGDGVGLGPAVKYVRDADGTIRQVR